LVSFIADIEERGAMEL